MLTPEQIRILGSIVLTDGKGAIYHDCVEHPNLPCDACVAAETGYWECKPHPKAETPSEILENTIWHIVSSVPEFDISPSSTDPMTAALWLVYKAWYKTRKPSGITAEELRRRFIKKFGE
jgi:hypothetical protein